MARRPDALDILYVGELPPFQAGTAIVGTQLLSGLAKLGHAVRTLAPITAEALGLGDRFAAEHPEIGVERFQVPVLDLEPSYIRPAADNWRDGIKAGFRILVARARPDVVIIGRERLVWYAPDVARAHRLPCVLLIHSVTLLKILDRSLAPATGRRMLAHYRKVDRMVLVAEHQTEFVQRSGFWNFVVIPNGVDLGRFCPRRKDAALLRHLKVRADQFVVVHASNLIEAKRPLDIVDSAERVLREQPEAVYVIVGDGPCRAAMEERCRQRGILDSVRFVGWVGHERIPEYLNLADVVAMPSEFEVQALVYLEAQACGRLLLASDIPAAREVIREGETGLLFRMGDVEDLAARTLGAAGDAALRARIGKQARAWVSAHHDVEGMVAAYEQALREVASQARP